MQTQSSHHKPLGASPVIRLGIVVIKLVASLIEFPQTPLPEKLMKTKMIASALEQTLIDYSGHPLIIIMRPQASLTGCYKLE